jgi:hypothetical protein
MEHFSDGKTMSWYESAVHFVDKSVNLNKVKASALQLKARRGVNTALK